MQKILNNLKSLYFLCVMYAANKTPHSRTNVGDAMKIINFFDEFFNNSYQRDLRIFGKRTKLKHAPKHETTIEKHKKHSRMFIKSNINTKTAKYSQFFGGLAYYDNIIDYQLKNEDAMQFNHMFFDFDKHNSKFESIKKKQSDAKEKLNGKAYFDRMNELQEQIQDLILFENLLNDSWQDAKQVNDYFNQQGLRTFCCLSASKGIHIRVFFEPIHINNYNRIVSDLYKNLTNQFNLRTLDFEVGVDGNPSKSVERLPYSYNEKSGLRVTPFSFEHDSLNDVVDKAMKLSEQRKLVNVDEFNLSDYVNAEFHNGILKLDSQIDVLVKQEQDAKQKLLQERIANGTINGTYNGNGGLFQDLRILVRFVCGEDNLVSEHELYDKYKCVFHSDRNPSAIVGKKNYQCLSSNCKINKINYFGFIKEWFHLKSDQEVKEKMVELQQLFDEKFGGSSNGGDAENVMAT